MSEVLWSVFEILVNLYQGLMVVYFAYVYLGDKNGRKYLHSPAVVFAIIFASIVTIINYTTVFEHLYAFVYVIIVFIYCLLCLKGTVLKKLYY